LKEGDWLETNEGKAVAISKIVVKHENTTVYNFKVADYHSYFVSNLNIWTHNSCDVPWIKAGNSSTKGTGKAVSDLDKIKSLIKKGEIKGNNIISKIDDKTQVIFRKDTGKNAHPIKPKYPNAVDHYNVEIQTKTSAGKWKSRESYHIVVDKSGKIIDRF